MRQQLYLVQGNGAAPQPIHSSGQGPSRYQQGQTNAPVEQVIEYSDQVDVEGFPDFDGQYS